MSFKYEYSKPKGRYAGALYIRCGGCGIVGMISLRGINKSQAKVQMDKSLSGHKCRYSKL